MNMDERICLPVDQFYHLQHSVVIFVFPVNMAPYTFYILLKEI